MVAEGWLKKPTIQTQTAAVLLVCDMKWHNSQGRPTLPLEQVWYLIQFYSPQERNRF